METFPDEGAARAWLIETIRCDDIAMARLEQLVAMLRDENARQNLVAASSLDAAWRRHIADSAQLLTHVPRETSSNGDAGIWLDLGTGAGFPGLVIAAICPDRPVWMVESRSRRVEWLETTCAALGLRQARVIGSPLERVATVPAGVISARAFAPLDRLVALSARFSTDATLWLLPKGRSAREELQALQGWRHEFRVESSLTDASSGIICGQLLGKGMKR